MQRPFKISSVLFTAFIVFGCSSKPREVTASLPLVSASQSKPAKKEIPSQYWNTLADAKSNSLSHDKYQISLSELYISALGQSCRTLSFSGKEQKTIKRIACEISYVDSNKQQQIGWFLEPQIIESSSYVEL